MGVDDLSNSFSLLVIIAHSLLRHPLQIEVFSELRSKKVATGTIPERASTVGPSVLPVQARAGEMGEPAAEALFVSQDDRQLLLALLLHCADIGNSVMPFPVAEQ